MADRRKMGPRGGLSKTRRTFLQDWTQTVGISPYPDLLAKAFRLTFFRRNKVLLKGEKLSTTKYQLVLQITEKTGVEEQSVKKVVQLLLDQIIEVLATEGRIELRNFGVFEVRTRKARKGRNPRTGEAVIVGKRRAVVFKMGKVMGKKVRGAEPKGPPLPPKGQIESASPSAQPVKATRKVEGKKSVEKGLATSPSRTSFARNPVG